MVDFCFNEFHLMKRVSLNCFLPLKLPKNLWFLGCFIGLLHHKDHFQVFWCELCLNLHFRVKNTLLNFLVTSPMVKNGKVSVGDMSLFFIFFQKHLEHFQIKKAPYVPTLFKMDLMCRPDLLGLKALDLFLFFFSNFVFLIDIFYVFLMNF